MQVYTMKKLTCALVFLDTAVDMRGRLLTRRDEHEMPSTADDLRRLARSFMTSLAIRSGWTGLPGAAMLLRAVVKLDGS